MMTEEKHNKKRLSEIQERLDRATPGPWMWDVNSASRNARLVTTHSGKHYVMKFQRWGAQMAAPSFQVFDKYEGPVTERGSQGMKRADKLLKSHPGKDHHIGYDDYIDHPDAELIAHAPDDIAWLISEVHRLQGIVDSQGAKNCNCNETGCKGALMSDDSCMTGEAAAIDGLDFAQETKNMICGADDISCFINCPIYASCYSAFYINGDAEASAIEKWAAGNPDYLTRFKKGDIKHVYK